MNRRTDPQCLSQGTSLVEMLAATVVLVILSTILVAAVQHSRSMSRDVVCRSHLSRLAIATGSYANAHAGYVFTNRPTPLQISNVVYHSPTPTGWGELYPRYLGNYHVLFCPSDPGRSPTWEYGWSNWYALPGTGPPHDPWNRGRHRGWSDPQPDHGRDDRGHNPQGRGPRRRRRRPPHPHPRPDPPASQVQCSYGYRGRQGIVPDAEATFTVATFEEHPQRVLGCDFYEPFFDPPRVHHEGHINVLRINGQVERVDRIVSFGPEAEDFQTALDALDRTAQSLQQQPAEPPGHRRRPR
ncbi:MAG: type II secretion system protein [Planctomycetota bacterium]